MTAGLKDAALALEARLAEITGRRYCVMTSRSTAALYLAFHTLAPHPGRIVFPAVLCPSPVYAALYAGHQPAFCDVDRKTGNMDPAALESLLAETPNVVAVMPTHLYGQPARMEEICAVAHAHDVAVVEDLAQALGATMPNGGETGCFGICSVLSFGHTKIIDAGYGGALVTDDKELAMNIRNAEAQLSEPTRDRGTLAATYSADYYRIRDAAVTDPRAHDEFLSFPARFRPLYLDRFDTARAAAINQALNGLKQTLEARRRKAAIYDQKLTGVLDPLHRDPGSAPWRYSVYLPPGNQVTLTNALRDSGFDASNWYPSLHRWFKAGREQGEKSLGRALAHESSVLNLWLDDSTDDDRVSACAEKLVILAEQTQTSMATP